MAESMHEILLKRFKPNPKPDDQDNEANGLSMLNDLKFTRILKDDARLKRIVIEVQYNGQPAVLILEKKQFEESLVQKIGNNFGKILHDGSNLFRNDIYGSYLVDILFNDQKDDRLLNKIFLSVIHPASPKDIEKFLVQPVRLIRETAEMYETFTKPYIEEQVSKPGHLQWLYNFLEGKAEQDRVVFKNDHFIMGKDMKWKCDRSDDSQLTDIEKTEIYINAIVFRRDIRTLRDLRQEHLPLLESIYEDGRKAISDKYKILPEELRVFIHYQPSFYHLHVHFTNINNEMAGFQCERAHPLSTVMENIRLMGNYYQMVTLEFPLAENSQLKFSKNSDSK